MHLVMQSHNQKACNNAEKGSMLCSHLSQYNCMSDIHSRKAADTPQNHVPASLFAQRSEPTQRLWHPRALAFPKTDSK